VLIAVLLLDSWLAEFGTIFKHKILYELKTYILVLAYILIVLKFGFSLRLINLLRYDMSVKRTSEAGKMSASSHRKLRLIELDGGAQQI
jgi:hypothetical protein